LYNLCYFLSSRIKMHLFRNLWHVSHVWRLFFLGPPLFSISYFKTKSLEKKMRTKLKKQKILHNSSIIICERMNNKIMRSKKTLFFIFSSFYIEMAMGCHGLDFFFYIYSLFIIYYVRNLDIYKLFIRFQISILLLFIIQ
jgi:hypothetical protein